MALPIRNRRRGLLGSINSSEHIPKPTNWSYPAPSGLTTVAQLSGNQSITLLPADRRPAVNSVFVAPEVHKKLAAYSDHIEPRALHTLHDVRIFSQNGVLINADNHLINDLSPDFKPRSTSQHRLLRYSGLPSPKLLKGHGFSLVSAASWKNYFHWLVDTLPTTRLFDWKDYDYILAPLSKPYHKYSYHALGIPEEKIIPLEHHSHYQTESLSHIPRGGVALIPDSAVQYLRNLFDTHPDESPTRKLYLSREDGWRRRITNEIEIFALLEPLGYERIVIGKRTIKEQARLFASASHVVGPHGAAMTNLVFSSPKTTLLECFSGTFMFPHFYHLCATLRQPYIAHWTENPLDAPDGPIDLASFSELLTHL